MSAFTITEQNLSTVARDTIVAGRRIERNYAALAAYYGLTHETKSADMTEAARNVVLAAYPDTDPARLSGKNKNDDQRWLDARTVRAGLVRAVKVEAEESDEDKVTNLLTRAGVNATLAEVTAAWEAAQS